MIIVRRVCGVPLAARVLLPRHCSPFSVNIHSRKVCFGIGFHCTLSSSLPFTCCGMALTARMLSRILVAPS